MEICYDLSLRNEFFCAVLSCCKDKQKQFTLEFRTGIHSELSGNYSEKSTNQCMPFLLKCYMYVPYKRISPIHLCDRRIWDGLSDMYPGCAGLESTCGMSNNETSDLNHSTAPFY